MSSTGEGGVCCVRENCGKRAETRSRGGVRYEMACILGNADAEAVPSTDAFDSELLGVPRCPGGRAVVSGGACCTFDCPSDVIAPGAILKEMTGRARATSAAALWPLAGERGPGTTRSCVRAAIDRGLDA